MSEEVEVKDLQAHPDDIIMMCLSDAMNAINTVKPREHSEMARRYAVLKTEMEKIIGYHKTFIIVQRDFPSLE